MSSLSGISTCKYCGETKELPLFRTNSKSCCKECYNKLRRGDGKAREARQKKKQEAIKYKGSICVKCNLEYDGKNACVFDFHHVDPSTKEYTPGDIMGWSWSKIKEEIDKCVLLCRNCHAMEHSEEY